MSIRAIYENGVFRPLEDVPVKEGTEVDVYPREETRLEKGVKPRRSVREYEVWGMWKDREDIVDSVEYVNRMRQPRWKRSE